MGGMFDIQGRERSEGTSARPATSGHGSLIVSRQMPVRMKSPLESMTAWVETYDPKNTKNGAVDDGRKCAKPVNCSRKLKSKTNDATTKHEKICCLDSSTMVTNKTNEWPTNSSPKF